MAIVKIKGLYRLTEQEKAEVKAVIAKALASLPELDILESDVDVSFVPETLEQAIVRVVWMPSRIERTMKVLSSIVSIITDGLSSFRLNCVVECADFGARPDPGPWAKSTTQPG